MNWDQVEGKWMQYSGKVREKWGKLTDSDMDVARGKRDQLVGRIQERYGIAREAAQEQVDEFVANLRDEIDEDAEPPYIDKKKVRRAGRT